MSFVSRATLTLQNRHSQSIAQYVANQPYYALSHALPFSSPALMYSWVLVILIYV